MFSTANVRPTRCSEQPNGDNPCPRPTSEWHESHLEPIGRDYSLELKTPIKARFVKVQFLKNGGDSYRVAHEIKVFAEP